MFCSFLSLPSQTFRNTCLNIISISVNRDFYLTTEEFFPFSSKLQNSSIHSCKLFANVVKSVINYRRTFKHQMIIIYNEVNQFTQFHIFSRFKYSDVNLINALVAISGSKVRPPQQACRIGW